MFQDIRYAQLGKGTSGKWAKREVHLHDEEDWTPFVSNASDLNKGMIQSDLLQDHLQEIMLDCETGMT